MKEIRSWKIFGRAGNLTGKEKECNTYCELEDSSSAERQGTELKRIYPELVQI